MITLVGRWEDGWLDPKVEAFMFRQLKGAFKFDRLVMTPKCLADRTSVDQFDTMTEALETCKGQKVFLEPSSVFELEQANLDPKDDLVFIFGNAKRHNLSHVKNGDWSLRIPTKGKTDMFAVNAASITLAAML